MYQSSLLSTLHLECKSASVREVTLEQGTLIPRKKSL